MNLLVTSEVSYNPDNTRVSNLQGENGDNTSQSENLENNFPQDQKKDELIYSDNQGKIYRENDTLYAWLNNSSKSVIALSSQEFFDYILKYPDATLDHFIDHFYNGYENDTEVKKNVNWYFDVYKNIYRANDLPSKDDLVNILKEHTREGNYINYVQFGMQGLKMVFNEPKFDHFKGILNELVSEGICDVNPDNDKEFRLKTAQKSAPKFPTEDQIINTLAKIDNFIDYIELSINHLDNCDLTKLKSILNNFVNQGICEVDPLNTDFYRLIKPKDKVESLLEKLQSDGYDLTNFDHVVKLMMSISSELTQDDLTLAELIISRVRYLVKISALDSLPKKNSDIFWQAIRKIWP